MFQADYCKVQGLSAVSCAKTATVYIDFDGFGEFGERADALKKLLTHFRPQT